MKRLLLLLFVSFFSNPLWAIELQFKATDIVTGQKTETHFEPGKKALVVTFLSAKCPCSDSHLVALTRLSEKYPEVSFVAIHSNRDEPAALTAAYFKKAKLPFPVLQDDDLHYADIFAASKTPHSFVVNPKGEVIYQGGVSDSKDFARSTKNFLEEALDDVRADQKVRTAEGRTLGCWITRGDEKAPWSP